MPTAARISPDFGYARSPTNGTERGYVDFYINGVYNIGIELTRDGNELTEHVARFLDGGTYSPLKLKSWVVVDFRQSKPHKATVALNPHCIFVVFSKDFATGTIMQAGKKNDVFHLRLPVDRDYM